MKIQNSFNFWTAIMAAVLISGCAYYSKTFISIQAEKLHYPMGVSAVELTNGTMNVAREMNAEGMPNHGSQHNP